MTLDKETIECALDLAGLTEDNVIYAYSGKGMYGRRCLAITGKIGDAMAFVGGLLQEEPSWDVEQLKEVYMDSLGMDVVVYWPGIQVAE